MNANGKLKRYSVTVSGKEAVKVEWPELSNTQSEVVSVDGVDYTLDYDDDSGEWTGEGIVVAKTKGKDPRQPFNKPDGGFRSHAPDGYDPNIHRTLQRVDFADPWDFRLFRVNVLLAAKREQLEKEYAEALESLDTDFAEDIRIVNELNALTPAERKERLASAEKSAAKAAADKRAVQSISQRSDDELASLLAMLSPEAKAKVAKALAGS